MQAAYPAFGQDEVTGIEGPPLHEVEYLPIDLWAQWLHQVIHQCDPDPAIAAEWCFDRVTGEPVPQDALKPYRQALAQYHLHPEAKFLHGDYLDAGPTTRRHIRVVSIEHIGKEANRWEEQVALGNDPEAQIVYGSDEHDRNRTIAFIREVADRVGRRALAEAAGVSVRETAAILRGERQPTARTLSRLKRAASDSGPVRCTEE